MMTLAKVIVPIFRNENNMMKFPQCVSYDIKKQVKMVVLYSLRTELLQRCTSWRRQFTKSEGTSRAAHFYHSHR